MVLLRGKVSWALSEGPGRAIRRNGLLASQTQLLLVFPSVLQAASSIFGRSFTGAYKLARGHSSKNSQYIRQPACCLDISLWLSARGTQFLGAHI